MDREPRKPTDERIAGLDSGAGAPVRPRKISVRALAILVSVALLAFLTDQLTKIWVVAELPPGKAVSVWGDILTFFFVRNSGAAFSLASGSTWIFSIAASAVTVIIIVFARRIRSWPWAVLFGMLLGGTVGNLTDRLFRDPGFGVGHVIDFLQVKYFPAVFNFADTFIVASMGLFVILTIRGTKLDGTRADDARRKSDAVEPPTDAAREG